jgi:hypothetical protein
MRYVFLVPTATAAVFVFGAVESGGLSLFPIYANRTGFTESQGALLLDHDRTRKRSVSRSRYRHDR